MDYFPGGRSTPIAEVFGFRPLPIPLILFIGIIVLFYSITAETAKRVFYKRVKVEQHRRFITPDELKLVFDAVAYAASKARTRARKERMRRSMLYCEFLLNTDLRREEALRILPSDADLARDAVYIRKTKDKEDRSVPLTKPD